MDLGLVSPTTLYEESLLDFTRVIEVNGVKYGIGLLEFGAAEWLDISEGDKDAILKETGSILGSVMVEHEGSKLILTMALAPDFLYTKVATEKYITDRNAVHTYPGTNCIYKANGYVYWWPVFKKL
jgi:hypothetical protein